MRNVVFYGASTLFPRLFAFLALFLYSRFLSVHDFGLYVFAIATGELCDYMCANWLRVGLLRFYHGPEERGGPVNLTRGYLACLGCTGVALLAAWPMAVTFVRGDWLHFATVISLYIVGNGAGQTASSTLRAEQRPALYLLLESVRPLANFAAGFAVVLLHPASYFPVALAAFTSHAAIGLLALGLLWSRRRSGSPSVEVKGMAIYAWPMAFAIGLNALIMSSDRYVLQAVLGPPAVALYTVAYSLGRQPLDIISFAFNLGGFSDLMRTFDREGPAAAGALMRRQITFLVALLTPGCVGLTLLASPLIHLLFDRRYWDHTPELIGVVACAAVFAGVKMSGFDQIFHMRRRADLYAWSLVPAAVLTPAMGALLIWTMGIRGAAVGGLFGYGISCGVAGVVATRLLPNTLPWIDIAKVLAASAIMGAAVWLAKSLSGAAVIQVTTGLATGLCVFGAATLALDTGDSRSLLRRFNVRVAAIRGAA